MVKVNGMNKWRTKYHKYEIYSIKQIALNFAISAPSQNQ